MEELRVRLSRLAGGRRAVWPAVAAAVVFAIMGAILVWGARGNPTLHLDMAFSRNACCVTQILVNEPGSAGVTPLGIVSGSRSTYSMPLNAAHVDRLRLPLGNVLHSSVVIRRIWITRGSRTVDEVSKAELRSISAAGAKRRALPGGVAFTTTTRQPSLDGTVSLDTGDSRARLWITRVTRQPLRLLVALLVAGALMTVAVATTRASVLLLASLASTLLTVRALPFLAWHLRLRDDVSQSVGFASYAGVWKTREQLVLELTAVAAVAVPALVVAVARRRRRGRPLADGGGESAADPPVGVPRFLKACLVGVPALVVATAFAPDLRSQIGGGRSAVFVPSWDSNALVFWSYLTQTTNEMPIRDFFWPYGFQWLFNLPVPWGLVVAYAVHLSWWALLAAGTYAALSRFVSGKALVLRVVVVTGIWLAALLASDVTFTSRYVAPLAVVLLFAGIDRGDRLISLRSILFGAALYELILFEVAQAVFALVPIVALTAAELTLLCPDGRRAGRPIARWIAIVAVPVLVAVATLGVTGTLGETAYWYRHVREISTGYAYPKPIDLWVTTPRDVAGLTYWAVPISLALGTYGFLKGRGPQRAAHAVVAALGLLGLMVMQRQVLRGVVDSDLWMPCTFGLVFWGCIETSLHPMRRRIAVAATAGALAAVALTTGSLRAGWTALAGGPTRVTRSVGALIQQRDEFAVDASAQFAPARFAKFGRYRPVVRTLRRERRVRAGAPIWILGDDTPVTMMLGASWPYYFSDFYDTSPVAFQHDVIRRLERTPPARVVWNFAPDAMIFDTVPHVVRVPLLFQWTIAHFALERRVGDFAILRPLRPRERPNLAWWRRRIGSSVDLGHIPEAAKVRGRSCSGDGCATYLIVDAPKSVNAITIPVTADGLRFNVIAQPSRTGRYVIKLDTLWFWRSARPTARKVDAAAIPGTVRLIRRTEDDDVLY